MDSGNEREGTMDAENVTTNQAAGWRSYRPLVALVALVVLTVVAMWTSGSTVGWISLLILFAYAAYLTPRAIRDWQRSRRGSPGPHVPGEDPGP
jgi:hypothetical protein